METISTDDLQILQEAVMQQERAASNKSFVEGFLARKYGLQNGDGVDVSTGKINKQGSEPSPLTSTPAQ